MNLPRVIRDCSILSVLGLGLAGTISGIVEQGKYEQTRRHVQKVIDVDKNGLITPQEWEPVYRRLGITPNQYSFGTGYGLEFSRKQLERYLENITGQ